MVKCNTWRALNSYICYNIWKVFIKILLALFRPTQLSHFQFNFILSCFIVLSVTYGFTVYQNRWFSFARLTSRLLKKSFWVFCISLTQRFRSFLFATRDDIVLSCLTLFNNLDLVTVAFHNLIFTNTAWLNLICFCFNGACLSNVYLAVSWNESRCFVSTFFHSNSFRRLFLNRLLSNCL